MSYWTRLRNALRPGRVEREIEEEIASHREEAAEAGAGAEAFGNELRYREASRDAKVALWLDSLRADVVMAWRQLAKRKAATLVVIVSLAAGIGSVLSAFRLFDAAFLRLLPIRNAAELHFLRYTMRNIDGVEAPRDSFSFAELQAMQAALGEDARLLMASFADRQNIIHGADDVERVSRQYISSRAFESFGIRPAAGVLFGAEQDAPGAPHQIAVLTADYAKRRYGSAAAAIGKSFRYRDKVVTITGVTEPKFFGTTTGAVIDVFLPLLANEEAVVGRGAATARQARILVHLRPGIEPGVAVEKLRAAFRKEREAMVATYGSQMGKPFADAYLAARLNLLPASRGVSNFNRDLRTPFLLLAATATLLLLLSCASAANLLTIQAGARAREMALRLSIGAGRRRLVQMMLVESLLLGSAAAAAGMLCAWWSAPWVAARLNPPDNPVRLQLQMDPRLVSAGVALALGVSVLFGLLPAWRASSTHPSAALKEGAAAVVQGRPARWMLAMQAAFCVVVCLVAGLLVHSLKRLDRQELGFAASRVLLLETFYRGPSPPPPAIWTELRERVKALPGVEAVALSGWPLQSGQANVVTVQVGGREPDGLRPYNLPVGPGWLDTMGVALLAGRDFRPGDTPSVAMVNQEFVRRYLPGRNGIGETFVAGDQKVEIIGVVRDVRLRELREAVRPTVFHPHGGGMPWGTVAIRLATGASHEPLLRPLRRLVADSFPQLRIDDLRLQGDFINDQTTRERLVAALATFFGLVALLLAGVGLYGVLSHTVSRRSREIAVRMALGARGASVAARVLGESAVPLALGCAAGLAAGRGVELALRSVLFEAARFDAVVMLGVVGVFVVSGAAAAWLPVWRAIRIDPARALRAE